MKQGWLLYERADAELNKSFIRMLQTAARQKKCQLHLHIAENVPQGLPLPDFIWNRTRNSKLVAHYYALGVKTFNSPFVNVIANDKFKAQQLARSLHIPCIDTWTEPHAEMIYPVVVKTRGGHGGKEVALCTTEIELNEQLVAFGKNSIIQPFISSNNQDVRIWVLGKTIIGAVKRTGKTFKSNYTLGGTIEKFNVPATLVQYVAKLVDTLQSDYIGIDFLVGEDGQFYFNEIEDPVGARSFFDLYEEDLPTLLIEYLINHPSI